MYSGVVVPKIGVGLKTTFSRSRPDLTHVFYSVSDKECDSFYIIEFQTLQGSLCSLYFTVKQWTYSDYIKQKTLL